MFKETTKQILRYDNITIGEFTCDCCKKKIYDKYYEISLNGEYFVMHKHACSEECMKDIISGQDIFNVCIHRITAEEYNITDEEIREKNIKIARTVLRQYKDYKWT